jgi:hypothetical protein
LTHFGAFDDAATHLDGIDAQLDHLAARARELPCAEFVAELRSEIEAACGPEGAARYAQGAPLDHIYDGLDRYWRKRTAAESAP